MRGRSDPAWQRFYSATDRAMILLCEGRISRGCYQVIYEQARKRALREQV